MRPSFLPKLVNGDLFDPVVYVRVLNERKAVMFDCGQIHDLANREILLVDSIFISHPHMDHFVGLDHVLRIILHRQMPLNVFGPEGITDKVLAKLHAYTWNLTQIYSLEIIIHEILPDLIIVTRTRASNGFEPESQESFDRKSPLIAASSRYSVEAVILDHNIPCLGFVLKEPFHINIRPDMLVLHGLVTGSWLGRLKELILADKLDTLVNVKTVTGEQQFRVSELMDALVLINAGQKIAYFTDLRYSQENLESIASIAAGCDILFIETFYLHELKEEAFARAHLTAYQAGEFARKLNARQVIPMHISPRYHHRVEEILKEVHRS